MSVMRITGLQLTDPDQPYWPALYTYMTIQRLFDADDGPRLERLKTAIGATELILLPRDGDISNYCAIFKAEGEALVVFEGTRGTNQIWQQIYGSCLTPNPIIRGRTGGYWSWYFNRRINELKSHLPALTSNYFITFSGHSLGGAIAQIMTNFFRYQTSFIVGGAVTFGSPRVGDEVFAESISRHVTRIVTEGDYITEIPPTFIESFFTVTPFSIVTHRYFHANYGRILNDDGSQHCMAANFANNARYRAGLALIRQGGFIENLHTPHQWPNYLAKLKRLMDYRTRPQWVIPIVQINFERDNIDNGIPLMARPIDAPSRSRVFEDPNVVIPTVGDIPTLPTEDVGRTMEVRTTDYQLYSFGGFQTVANAFRGHDRRILTELVNVLQAVKNRDTTVQALPHSRRVSNRQLMFPPAADNNPATALETVLTQATQLLAQQNAS